MSQNRDKWVVEITREDLIDILEAKIENLYDKIKLLKRSAEDDTRDAFKIDFCRDSIALCCNWSRFVSAMEPERKLFLTFEDHEFFFGER